MRFSIRDLLWATLVVALCFAWWVDRQDIKRQATEESAAAIAAAEGKFEAAMALSSKPFTQFQRVQLEEMGKHWNDPEWWDAPDRRLLRDMVRPNLKPQP
jgi:hypothetical protein